jgi:hypothetical protein
VINNNSRNVAVCIATALRRLRTTPPTSEIRKLTPKGMAARMIETSQGASRALSTPINATAAGAASAVIFPDIHPTTDEVMNPPAYFTARPEQERQPLDPVIGTFRCTTSNSRCSFRAGMLEIQVWRWLYSGCLGWVVEKIIAFFHLLVPSEIQQFKVAVPGGLYLFDMQEIPDRIETGRR